MKSNPRGKVTTHPLALAMVGATMLASTAGIAAPLSTEAAEVQPLINQDWAVEALPWRLTQHSPDLPPAELAGFVGLFAPRTDTPDYVLTWREQKTGPLRWVTSTMRRHGSWVRTDTSDGAATSSEYLHVPTGIVVTTARNEDGPIRHFGLGAPERTTPRSGIDYPAALTGQTGSFSGEPCRWWDVYSGLTNGQPTFRHQACVTGDGIEVASRTLDGDGEVRLYSFAWITELVRRPVLPEDVQPGLAGMRGWFEEATAGDDHSSDGNFTVLLSMAGNEAATVIRRRGSWRGEQGRTYDGSMSMSAYDNGGLSVSARVAPDGRPVAVVYRHHPFTDQTAVPIDAPEDTVLGLRCRWVDLKPYMSDAGRHECRTSEGIPLKIRLFSRGGNVELVAERLDRNAGSVQDLMPPPSLMDLAIWGVSR